MNYSTLRQQVLDMLSVENEESFRSNLDALIQRAETSIHNRVILPDARTSVTGTVSASPWQMPSDLKSILSLYVNSMPLLPREYSYIKSAWGTATGAPKDYAFFKRTIPSGTTEVLYVALGPAPDTSYSYELNYERRPISITETTVTTNTWLADNHPDLLVYQTVLEGAMYFKMWEQLPVYQAKVDQAFEALQLGSEGRMKVDSNRDPELTFGRRQ